MPEKIDVSSPANGSAGEPSPYTRWRPLYSPRLHLALTLTRPNASQFTNFFKLGLVRVQILGCLYYAGMTKVLLHIAYVSTVAEQVRSVPVAQAMRFDRFIASETCCRLQRLNERMYSFIVQASASINGE